MKTDALNVTNFVLYAAKHYNNPACNDDEEFFSDLKRIKYVKRLLKKYEECGDLKERLILNHIIVLYNVFGPTVTTRLLFFKLAGHYSSLKPFLEFLGYLPEVVYNVGLPPKNINTSEIVGDNEIAERLKAI